MENTISRRLLAGLCALALTLASTLSPAGNAIAAGGADSPSGIDDSPPSIEHDVIDQAQAGDTQVFVATVRDNRTVSSVQLFYRIAGETAYTAQAMQQLGDSPNFSVSVDTGHSDAKAIEYYIEAKDEAGNRVLYGFTFDPLIRTLTPSQPVDAAVPAAATPEPQTPLGRKLLYAALAVLVVGGIAAAVDQSGDSRESSSGSDSIADDPGGDSSGDSSGSGSDGSGAEVPSNEDSGGDDPDGEALGGEDSAAVGLALPSLGD